MIYHILSYLFSFERPHNFRIQSYLHLVDQVSGLKSDNKHLQEKLNDLKRSEVWCIELACGINCRSFVCQPCYHTSKTVFSLRSGA